VAVSPDGKNASVTDFGNTVSQFKIGANGVLRAKTPAPVATGNFPFGIAVSPDSQSVYVADHGDRVYRPISGDGHSARAQDPADERGRRRPRRGRDRAHADQIRLRRRIAGRNAHIQRLTGGGSTSAVILNARLVRAATVGFLVQRIVGKSARARWAGAVQTTSNRATADPLGPAGGREHAARGPLPDHAEMFDRRGHLIALAHPSFITVK
jgi:DNA-binding beta-propeller fold protein YncE